MLRERAGAKLVVAPIDATGGFDLAAFEALLSPRTKMVAVTHISNVTGAICCRSSASPSWRMPPAPRCWSTAARRCRACRSTCGRSAATSMSSPATRPTGLPAPACCTAATTLLEAMPPWQTGGGMILNVKSSTPSSRSRRTASRPAPRHRRRGGARAGDRFHRRDRPRARSASTRRGDRLRDRHAVAQFPASHRRRPGSGGSACCRSISTASIRTMSARCSTSTTSRCGSATIARSR